MKSEVLARLTQLRNRRVIAVARVSTLDGKISAAEAFLKTLDDEDTEEESGALQPSETHPALRAIGVLNGADPHANSNGARPRAESAIRPRQYGANIQAVRSVLPKTSVTIFNVHTVVSALRGSATELDEYQAGQALRKLAGKEILVVKGGSGRRPNDYKLNPDYKPNLDHDVLTL